MEFKAKATEFKEIIFVLFFFVVFFLVKAG